MAAVDDATHGKVWRFCKPAGQKRCESRGVRADTTAVDHYVDRLKIGSTYGDVD